MKKHFYLLLFLSIFFAQKSKAQCNTWVPLAIDDTIQASFGTASYMSISNRYVSAFPIPYHYAIYSDGTVGGKASVLYPTLAGGTSKWLYIGAKGFTPGQALYTTIQKGNTNIYAAYQDMTTANKAAGAMMWNGTTWTAISTAAGFSKGTATQLSMAVAVHKGVDSVFVAYRDGAHHNRLTVLMYSGAGTTWDTIGKAGFSPGAASYISLQVDTSGGGGLYVAYSDSANKYRAIVYVFTKSSGWTVLGGAPASALKASYISLNAIKKNDILVAFRDSLSSNKGKVMEYSGGTWTPYGSATGIFTKGPVSYVSMVSSSDTSCFIGYNDDSLGYANVMNYTGSTWQQWGNANFSAGRTSFDCISYLNIGLPEPFILYRDVRVDGKATVMVGGQYATTNFNYAFPPMGISQNYAYTPSIAMNRTTRLPVVAFVNQDTLNHERVRVKTYNGSAWNYIGGNLSNAKGKRPSMGVNRDTNYVAYIDVALGNYPVVKKFNGTTWVGVGSASGQVAASKCNYVSLAFDYKNQPYVAFDDGTQGGAATVEYYNGSSWVVLGTAGFNKGGPGGRVAYPAMAIYHANVYVVFSDSGQSWRPILWEYHSGGWSNIAAVSSSLSGSAAFLSITVDSSSNVYMAMQDSGLSSDGATVTEYPSSGTLTTLGTFTTPISAGVATGESIALDTLFNPYISYIDATKNDKVTVLSYNGSAWNTVGTAGISEGAAITTTQLAILGTTPFVTYQDRGTIIKEFASAPTGMKILPALSVVCLAKDTVKLTASGGGATYTWSPGGATGAALTVHPSATTIYTVKSAIAGCPATATATVDVSASGDDIFTMAGTGNPAYNGDGGPAISAAMYYATGVTFDSNYQNMYIADQQNSVVRKVNMATNIITTIAGNGIIGAGNTGDGNPATAALLNWPSGLVIYHDELYIADQVNNAIRVVNLKTNIIETYAGGNGTPGSSTAANGDGGPATAAQLNNPTGMAFDSKGNMYIADNGDNRIREVSTSGTISTYAGSGNAGYSGNSLSLLLNLNLGIDFYLPTSIAIDASNNIYIADRGNDCIRKITPGLLGSTLTTIAGIGTSAGYSGDGGAATAAKLNQPIGVTLDGAGNIYITDEHNNRIREILASTGIINTIAGNGTAAASSTAPDGDGGPAVSAQLNYPWAVALDNAANIYIPDNFNNRVREIKTCSVPATTIKATPNPICAGSTTKITVTGGNYYSWAPSTGLSSVSTATVTATPTVTTIYSVTVNGSVTDTITIHVLPTPTVSISSSSHVCSSTDDTIRYGTNGTPTWTATGATITTTTANYIVANITTPPAKFVVDVTNGTCSAKDSITVTVGTPTITVVSSPTSVCRGSIDTLTASGATTYTWAPTTGINTSTGASVIATPTTTASTVTYTVTGTATGGCNATGTVTVTVNSKPLLNVSSTSPSICNGNSTTVIENTSVASYLWSTGASTQSISVTPAITTTYTVIGTTSLGCSDTATTTVTVTNGVPFSITDTGITCNGLCNGSATAVVSGTDTYTYQWNNGATSTNPEITGLCPGMDSVVVTDQVSGCIGQASTTIIQPAPLKDTLSSLMEPLCNGSCDATARDTIIGGTAPFNYTWSTTPPQTTQTATSLCAGTYTVNITDSNNCKATYSFTVLQPATISLSVTSTAAKCYGSSTGSATAKVVGGSGSYTYSWSTTPAQTTSTATGLAAGTYTVTIADVNGCTAPPPATVTITQAGQIQDTITGVTGEKCYGGKTGAASITVNGGLPAYSYQWSDGETASNAITLPGGVVSCTVTDKNGCTVTDTVTIIQPRPINISKDDTTICPGAAATLIASASGGASPYTYLWNNFVSGQTNRVTPGSTTEYTVTVTDNIGCKNSVVDTVNVSPPIVQGSVTQSGSSSCVGSAITLTDNTTGGTGIITYTWQPGGQTGSTITITPSAGTTNYTVTVSDGCASTSVKDSIGVTMYNPVFSVCCDTTIIQGQSVTLVSSPSAGITFAWTPSTGLSCTACPDPIATPTINTTYTVVGTSSGCTTIDSVTVKLSNGTLVFYTGITPNGDGSNDTWIIDNIELYPNNSVSIFNRWGIEVWSGNNYNNSSVVWSGNNSSGQPLPDGTYFYVVTVNGTTYKGWVQVTR